MSEPKARSAPFAYAAMAMYRQFCEERPGDDMVLVTTTLHSGRQFFSFGFRAQSIEDVPACIMIEGAPAESSGAILVRDSDVANIEFERIEGQGEQDQTPFGFFPRRGQ